MILRDIKKLASKTVLALLSFGLLAGIAGCTQTRESYSVSDLSTKGYVVTEVADGGFYITENDVDYYFENNMYGKPAFKKVIVMYPSSDINLHNQGIDEEISIINEGRNRMTVIRKIPYIDTKNNGEIKYSSRIFELKNDFEVESITNNRGFSDVAGRYEYFTSEYMSTDELNSYYCRGFELEEEIN